MPRLCTCSLNLNITLVLEHKTRSPPRQYLQENSGLWSKWNLIETWPSCPLLSLSTQTIFFNEYKKQKFIEINVHAWLMNFLEGWHNACKQEHLHSLTLHTFLSNLENVLQNHGSSRWGRWNWMVDASSVVKKRHWIQVFRNNSWKFLTFCLFAFLRR